MLAEPLILRSNRQAEAENLFSVNSLHASVLNCVQCRKPGLLAE
ncbi:hypothetical protein F385_2860 [Pantoea agglomerans 299R]|nr:hypothetical protein F385_2860 [Pantoea agglomerans 299R]